jgi:hypothetical protein
MTTLFSYFLPPRLIVDVFRNYCVKEAEALHLFYLFVKVQEGGGKGKEERGRGGKGKKRRGGVREREKREGTREEKGIHLLRFPSENY